MKNEQTANQTGKQQQDVKNPLNKQPGMQQQDKNEDTDLSMARPGSSPTAGKQQAAGNQQQTGSGQKDQGSAKGNINVDNEGRIGKAHDMWDNDNNNRNKDEQQKEEWQTGSEDRTAKNKSVTEPEIDAPIYDPEKTEKKIPQMEANKNNKSK